MLTLEQRLRPHPDVAAAAVDDDTTALLHLGSEMYFSLNATGTRIWQDLHQGLPLREISRRLQEAFGIAAQEAERDVLELLAELAEHGLVELLE